MRMPRLRSSRDSNETSNAPKRTREGKFFSSLMRPARGVPWPRPPGCPPMLSLSSCVFRLSLHCPKAVTLINTCSFVVLFPPTFCHETPKRFLRCAHCRASPGRRRKELESEPVFVEAADCRPSKVTNLEEIGRASCRERV